MEKTYSQREFVNYYSEEIGYIISLIRYRCQHNSFKIIDEKKLFKILIYNIFKESNRRKLVY